MPVSLRVPAVTSEARRRPANLCVACIAKVAFGFLNGFHDAADSTASIVSTRVLRPPHTLIGRLAGAAVARGGYAAMVSNDRLSTLAIRGVAAARLPRSVWVVTNCQAASRSERFLADRGS